MGPLAKTDAFPRPQCLSNPIEVRRTYRDPDYPRIECDSLGIHSKLNFKAHETEMVYIGFFFQDWLVYLSSQDYAYSLQVLEKSWFCENSLLDVFKTALKLPTSTSERIMEIFKKISTTHAKRFL